MPIPAIGEPLPAFSGRLSDGQLIRRDDLAGSFTTLCFFGSAGVPQMAAMVNAVTQNGDIFDGLEHRFVGVSIDPDDAERLSSISGTPPAVQWIFDFDQQLSHLFGAAIEQGHDEEVPFQPLTVLVDASLRVLACHKISDPQEHANTLPQFLSQLPIQGPPRPANAQAPVLFVPMVFEPEFCRRLIEHFEEVGGHPSGILEDEDGKTSLQIVPSRKQRLDALLSDQTLQQAAHARIARRVAPEIKRAFQFEATRLERSVIARYGQGDFFARHRDNAALGTAHRNFSITIPLNANEHAGGYLRFPEFGPQLYQAPTGCAIIHSCSLLHELVPVQEGQRFAYIPIVYGEAGAQLREKNRAFLAEGVSPDRREVLVPASEEEASS